MSSSVCKVFIQNIGRANRNSESTYVALYYSNRNIPYSFIDPIIDKPDGYTCVDWKINQQTSWMHIAINICYNYKIEDKYTLQLYQK